ncbi:MAG TPA: beta-L-arabinofuranosidase domain-containing protein [Thermoclostridium sp.]|nr:beta-L-arabinofuranosidase domain-containing protein [Thermoclostridium sp.]
MIKKINRDIDLNRVKIADAFWSKRQALITDTVIPYQEKILDDKVESVEKSHAFANFRIAAGLEEGEFFGMVFQDSDVAKWLEAVAYSLCVKPDADLEKRADQIIDIIAKAQQPDGYLNTYFTIKEPEKRWKNLHECHELYCAGHMMEAAAAYYKATGKDKLLNVMERMSDHIENHFITEKREGIPGHQEIEIGLMKLYHVTGKEKFLKLALHFINERGKEPDFFIRENNNRGWKHESMDPYNTKYNQSYAPVREQKTAEGHSVRAVYMYTAMADIAALTADEELLKACELIWDNIVNKRMYITGGIGSNAHGESFTIDYDLPNDSVYAETCASIGLMFFAREMLDICPSSKYSDVMELALYNGVLSGMQLDGKRFFYVNPLEVNPKISGELFGFKHVLPERPGWYQCACCPPNVARLLTSLGKYQWGEGENTIYSHLYIGGTAELDLATIVVESELPWEGKVSYTVKPTGKNPEFSLAIRIPSYAKETKILLNGKETEGENDIRDGYCYINRMWYEGDTVQLIFDMPARRIYSNTRVRENIGCVAIMRGPIIYCFEGIDNEENIHELHINKGEEIIVRKYEPSLLSGIVPLKIKGTRIFNHDNLYFEGEYSMKTEEMMAIPYFAWGNRGLNQMRIWMHEI